MTESFEYKGTWYLPGNESNKVNGILNYDLKENRIDLDVVGYFGDDDLFNKKVDFILGETTNGKKITLYQCLGISFQDSYPGISTGKFIVNRVIVGAHFSSYEQLKFESIQGGFINFEEWVDISGFETINRDESKRTVNVKYELPAPVQFDISPTLTGHFLFGYSLPDDKKNSFSINQFVTFGLAYKDEVPLKSILGDFSHFSNFVSIGLYNTTIPFNITLVNRENFDEINGEKIPKKIQLFLKYTLHPSQIKQKSIHDTLFVYDDIKKSFPTIISRWYEIKEKILPSLSILSDIFRLRGRFSENHFLNLAQAIETFHRRFRNNEVLPKAKHKAKIEEIINSVQPQHKTWLKDRLNFSNEPTLHARLKELINEFDNITLRSVIDDYDKFIVDVKNNRNYYTHYDQKLEKKAMKANELYFVAERLKILLICAILKETGLTNQQIEEFLNRNEWTLFNHILINKRKYN